VESASTLGTADTDLLIHIGQRRKPPKGVVMEPTRIELLEAWITIQKLLQTDPKLDEYHKQILPDVLSLLNHRQDKLKGRE
jgi:hypothetical protein